MLDSNSRNLLTECKQIGSDRLKMLPKNIRLQVLHTHTIKSIYAGILEPALFNAEIYHQYKQTSSVHSIGKVWLLIRQFFKF